VPSTTLAQLAEIAGGELSGNGSLAIDGAATLDLAGRGQITLVDRAERYPQFFESGAAATVGPRHVPPPQQANVIFVENVHQAFARIVEYFRPPRQQPSRGISPQANIAATAKLGRGVNLLPGALIGEDVEIGDRCTIYPQVCIQAGCRLGSDVTLMPGVVLYENTVLGNRVLIHAGAVLGAYGFGYELVDGRHHLGAQLGYVDVGDDVEIGANTTIDRGTYGATTIGSGTKIDNLVQIGHNCRIGRNNILCAQVGVAGSTSTGDYVTMAGQVGVRDHVHIGDRAVLGAKAGVSSNVPAGLTYMGVPAIDMRDLKVRLAATAKLPDMRRQVKAMQRQVEQLQQRLAELDAPPLERSA